VQVYRRGRKILSLWPRWSRLKMHSRWRYKGRVERLRPGVHTWIVWPAFGTRANPRYGRMVGLSTFRFVG
jgi:hypothetical protein